MLRIAIVTEIQLSVRKSSSVVSLAAVSDVGVLLCSVEDTSGVSVQQLHHPLMGTGSTTIRTCCD